jgi:WhiB family redox-sensing transcriptional regulator
MTEVFIPLTQIYGVDNDSQLSWMDLSRCAEVGGDFHFPEKGGSTREAKRVCRSCPVRAECLEYALGHDERFGIWGGFSERERRRLKREPAGTAIAAGDATQAAARTAAARQAGEHARVNSARIAEAARTERIEAQRATASPAQPRKAA